MSLSNWLDKRTNGLVLPPLYCCTWVENSLSQLQDGMETYDESLIMVNTHPQGRGQRQRLAISKSQNSPFEVQGTSQGPTPLYSLSRWARSHTQSASFSPMEERST